MEFVLIGLKHYWDYPFRPIYYFWYDSMVITRPAVTALVVCLFGSCGLLAKPVANQITHATSKARTATKVSSARTLAARKNVQSARTPYRKPAPRQSIAPLSPTSNRIREVQEALTERGYLQSEVSGTWNAASIVALKRFEADQKVRVDGKIDAKILIALGLGPKYDNNLNLPVPGASGNVVAADQATSNESQRN